MIAELVFNKRSLDKTRKLQSQRTTQFITMPIRLSNMPLQYRGRKTISKLPFKRLLKVETSQESKWHKCPRTMRTHHDNAISHYLATRRNRNAITGTCRGKETIWVSTKLY